MSAMTNYMEKAVTNHFFRNTATTSPVAVYLAMYESAPGEDGSGTEASYTNYTRVVSTWSEANEAGEIYNTGSIVFPANGDAGDVTLTHAAVFDAVAGGNMLIKGVLSVPKTIQSSDVIAVGDGQLKLTFD